MISATRRLPRADFAKYFKAGQRYQSPHFTLVINITSSPTKAAVVVSKKVAKSAVDRNRLRRRAYGVIATHPVFLGTGVYILIYKAGALASPRLSLAAELTLLLANSGKPR